MSTLYTDNIRANNASQITLPTGQKIVGTDAGSIVAPGGLLQVQQGFKSDAGTIQSSSFTNISNLEVNITPHFATSKILVMYDLSMTIYNLTAQTRILRDSTAIAIGDAAGSRTRVNSSYLFPTSDANHSGPKHVGHFLDSPNTTNQITYRIQGKTQSNNVGYLNRTGNDADNGDWSQRQASSITVMEIAQ